MGGRVVTLSVIFVMMRFKGALSWCTMYLFSIPLDVEMLSK